MTCPPLRLPGVLAFALLGLSTSATGCALTKAVLAAHVRECDGFDVPLSTLAVSSRKELRVKVLARRVDNDFPFVVESSADSFVLIGFTPLGTKAFTLERRGDAVKVDNLVGPAQIVPPRNVMADVLAMSVPSTCSTTPDGMAASAVGVWQLTDTCKDGRPVMRRIARPGNALDAEPEVEVEYGQDAIVVRQKHCRYAARYVLQGAPVQAAASTTKAAPATPATSAAPAAQSLKPEGK